MVTYEYPQQAAQPSVSSLDAEGQNLNLRPQKTPEIDNESLESVSQLQWKCPELSLILNYLVPGTVPDIKLGHLWRKPKYT